MRTESPNRQSIRLPGWDYRRAGWYFVTINTWGSVRMLARVQDRRMVLTRMGAIVAACWDDIPNHHPRVRLDAFVVMPNHIHGIIVISRSPSASQRAIDPAARGGLGTIVGSFKAACTRRVRREVAAYLPLWHRNYYERILPDADAVTAVRRYIAANPARWIARRG